MDYKTEILNIIDSITDVRILAFLYGLFDEIMRHVKEMEELSVH